MNSLSNAPPKSASELFVQGCHKAFHFLVVRRNLHKRCVLAHFPGCAIGAGGECVLAEKTPQANFSDKLSIM